jgi:hypothetical protein
MPKNKVSDPITDQEMAFARLVLSGAMTDRQAAEAAGLNPDSAAYTKSKPHVRAYMLEHRAAVEQQLVQQEADLSRSAVDGLHRLNLDREQVLARLWEIANLSPEMTRNSITGQVKALSMIIAMENFIPDRKAVSEKKSPTPPAQPKIYKAEWLREQQATTMEPPPSPTPTQQEDSPVPPVPARRGARRGASRGAEEAIPACPGVPRDPGHSQTTFVNRISPSEAHPTAPYVSDGAFVPDARAPFSIKRNPFSHFLRPR